jgi:cytochrome P450
MTEPTHEVAATKATVSNSKPVPAGTSGLPLLGETLAFIKNGFGFVEDRTRRFGPIFRTRILGRDAAVIIGPDASGEFIDPRHVQRHGAMLPHVQELMGGNALPVLDGEEHFERKHFVLAAFSREALWSYVPKIQMLLSNYMNRWAASKEIRWVEELKHLSLEMICDTVMGMPSGQKMDRLREDYETVLAGFTSLPIPFPGTAYTKAKHALNRIFSVFDENIREHQQHPREDGLSRILAAKSPTNGRAMTPPEARTELHHIVIAGLIVWAWLASRILQLDRHPEVLKRLQEEVKRQAPRGPLTLDQLEGMIYLNQVTMEVRRMAPVVHVFFGKARQTFEFKGHSVPAGWMVLWGHRSSHMSSEIYSDPERFDPDRFAPPRSEQLKHEHAFVPNGAGAPTGHKCAGAGLATYFLQIFTVELLRGYSWTLMPGQDLSYDWKRLPAEPRDQLRAAVKRAAS